MALVTIVWRHVQLKMLVIGTTELESLWGTLQTQRAERGGEQGACLLNKTSQEHFHVSLCRPVWGETQTPTEAYSQQGFILSTVIGQINSQSQGLWSNTGRQASDATQATEFRAECYHFNVIQICHFRGSSKY